MFQVLSDLWTFAGVWRRGSTWHAASAQACADKLHRNPAYLPLHVWFSVFLRQLANLDVGSRDVAWFASRRVCNKLLHALPDTLAYSPDPTSYKPQPRRLKCILPKTASWRHAAIWASVEPF